MHKVFEQFIITEVRSYLSYKNKKSKMFFWRTTSKIEVDLIIQDEEKLWAIEIKSRSNLSAKNVKGLKYFCEDHPHAKRYVITLDARRRIDEFGNEIFGCIDFIKKLWSDEILDSH